MLPLTSCKKSQLEEAEAHYEADYAVAVVKTTQQLRSSYIEYYDENLNLIRNIWYPYAGLFLTLAGDPPIYADELYLIPQGLMGQQDDRKLVSLNLLSGAIREYRVDQISLDGVAVDERYCYVTSDLNGVGHISRVDKASGEITYLDTPNVFPGGLVVQAGQLRLFCLDCTGSDDMLYLSTYSRNLELMNRINLTSLAGLTNATSPIASHDGCLFFISSIQPLEEDQPFLNSMYSFNTQDSKLKSLCELHYETRTILLKNDKIFAFCAPSIPNDDFYIEIYDSTSGALLSSLHIDYPPKHGLFRGNTLFVRGNDILVRYGLDDMVLTEEARVSLMIYDSNTTANLHHSSDMFVRP
jgi:hypothetical protein